MDVLWAGWRSEYVKGAGREPGECLFCRLPDHDDDDALILERAGHAYSVLNLFPYTTGHLMVAPFRHVPAIAALSADEVADAWRLLARAERACRTALEADGFNVGINLGRVAGAGVPGHLHLHLVPRWEGDTNFMTTTAEARVVPEDLPSTLERLRDALG